jgi:hypothetical protein
VADWVPKDEVLDLIEREQERDREWKRNRWGSPAPGPVMSHEDAGRMFAAMRAIRRLRAALDIVYGVDMWPSKWTGPMRRDTAPGGPPADLRAAVKAHEAEQDEQRHQAAAGKSFGNAEELLRRMDIPPA